MLGSFERRPALERLANGDFDIAIVGGGITGAGAALDAASRGFKTALIERDDFASGTSSRSSKLVHGGLRYLQQRQFRLVYEALFERQRLLENAPHLVRELPFLLPVLTKDGLFDAKLARAVGSAMWTYDLTGGLRIGRLHKRISTEEALERAPVLREDKLTGAYLYFDCETDDARLTLTLARTAALEHGAAVANGVAAVELLKEPGGGVTGVRGRTAEGDDLVVRAKVVVNAAGVWADEVSGLDDPATAGSLRPAKGIHVVFPWSRFRNTTAVILPGAGDASVFLVPAGPTTYVGTTDTDYEGPLDDPRCTSEDVDALIRAVRRSTTADVSEADVMATWAGLRPLVSGAAARSADLSRRHQITTSSSGLVTVIGGKLTTYRRMAADAIDTAQSQLNGSAAVRRGRTKRLRLRGAADPQTVSARCRQHRLVDAAAAQHLANRYGDEADVVLAMLDRDPSLVEPLVPGLPYLRAEAVFAARYEMVRSLIDLLGRRTRALTMDAAATAAAAPEAASLVAPELDWAPSRVRHEVDQLTAAASAHRCV